MFTTSPVDTPCTRVAEVAEFRFRAAFAAVQEELAALSIDELLPLNVDIPSAVVRILGSWPKLRQMRPHIVHALSDFDLRHFDRLETYALAAAQAHAQFLAASRPEDSQEQELAAQLESLSTVLKGDTDALIRRGMLDGSRLKALRGTTGHKNLVFDLLLLVTVLRGQWGAIAGRTGVTLAELDQAEELCTELATAVARRGQMPSEARKAQDIRQRAFTLMVRAHQEVRRAVAYLRWYQGDVDRFMPSIYAYRQRKGRRKAAVDIHTPKTPGTTGTPTGSPPPTPVPVGSAPAPAPPAPAAAPRNVYTTWHFERSRGASRFEV